MSGIHSASADRRADRVASKAIDILDLPRDAAFVVGGYALLGLADMALSSLSFVLGIREANPVLAWASVHHLFVLAKLLLTGLVASLLLWMYPRPHGRQVAWLAASLTAAVIGYHLWGLHIAHLGRSFCLIAPRH